MRNAIIGLFLIFLGQATCQGLEERYRREFVGVLNKLDLQVGYSDEHPTSMVYGDRELLDSLHPSEYVKDAIISQDLDSVLLLIEDNASWYTCLYFLVREGGGWTVHPRLMARKKNGVLPLNTWVASMVKIDGQQALLKVARKLPKKTGETKVHLVYYDYESWDILDGVRASATIRWSRY
jgi:hypothetical protein